MRLLVTIDLAAADLDAFERYEATVLPLVTRHGGRVDFRVRALDDSREIHLLTFPDPLAYGAFKADPDRLAAQDLWDASKARSDRLEVRWVEEGR